MGDVPADCVGRLEDRVPENAIDVALGNRGPTSGALAPLARIGLGDAAQERWRPRQGRLALDSFLKKGYGRGSWCDSGSGRTESAPGAHRWPV
jgi:hypothetical protein